MENIDSLIFIDTNQYLDFYETITVPKLLASLTEQKDYIFVTAQVVAEFQRNKLRVAVKLLNDLSMRRTIEVPDFFDISEETVAKLREKLRDSTRIFDEVKTELMRAAPQTLDQISRSEDKVSKALEALFRRAVEHTPGELKRARERRERGYAPGKRGSLGDPLNWEQLLSYSKGKSKLWIISKDSDYCTKHEGKMFLNAFLYQDLVRLNHPTPAVFCFDGIDEGIRHFVETTGVKAEKLPTAQESQEIKKELDSLPPRFTWLDTSMDDANMVAILSAHSRQMSPALWAAISAQGLIQEMKPDPDKNGK